MGLVSRVFESVGESKREDSTWGFGLGAEGLGLSRA